MTFTKRIGLALALLALAIVPLGAAQYQLLHSFAGGTTDGGNPEFGAPVLSGSTLYGMTRVGGSSGGGTIFKIGTDGNNYAVIHNFTGGTTDGAYPYGSLLVSGSTLYGMTSSGGTSNEGTIFKIGMDGNNFGFVHEFQGGSSDGAYPYGDLLLIGSTFYGLTDMGGSGNKGVIFKVDTNGSNFAVLHSFAGGTSDGQTIHGGGLVTDGTYLYGMTCGGGSAGFGVVFSLKLSDSSFSLLYSFLGDPSTDGANPYGQLLLSDATLYGLTYMGGGTGGAEGKGTIFKIDTDGSDYQILHYFVGAAAADGQWPQGSLILLGTRLLGLTVAGGKFGTGIQGTIFDLKTDQSDYVLPWVFGDTASAPGSTPKGSLLIDGTMAYGMTSYGGASGAGTVFSFDTTPRADIAISKWPDNSTPQGGSDVTFTVQARSNGPARASGVQVTDLLPAGLTYVSDSHSQGAYDHTTGIWNIGGLTKDSTVTLSITAKVIASGTIVNTATRTAENEIDPNSGNDQATGTITTANGKNLLPPILLTPASGTTGQPATATLKWQDTNNSPQEIKYKVRIKKAGGAYVNYTLAAGTTQYIKSGLAAGKTYFWNIQAVGNGTTSKTSPWANGGVDWSFTVAPPATLTPPTLLTPASGATGQSLSPTLYWGDTNSSPNELHYKVRFKIAGGAYTVTTLGPDVTSLAKTGLRSGKTYYWSVMAIGNGTTIKNSVWPADYHFTTGIIK